MQHLLWTFSYKGYVVFGRFCYFTCSVRMLPPAVSYAMNVVRLSNKWSLPVIYIMSEILK